MSRLRRALPAGALAAATAVVPAWGEDYELRCTLSGSAGAYVVDAYAASAGSQLTSVSCELYRGEQVTHTASKNCAGSSCRVVTLANVAAPDRVCVSATFVYPTHLMSAYTCQ